MKRLLLICILCFWVSGLTGCGGSNSDSKEYTIKVLESVGDSKIVLANVTLIDNLDESVVDNEEYLDTFLKNISSDLKIKEQASVIIKDISGNKVGSVLFTKQEGKINYIFSPEGGSGISGIIK